MFPSFFPGTLNLGSQLKAAYVERHPTHPPTPVYWSCDARHRLHSACCVCVYLLVSSASLHCLWAPCGQGTCLSESPLYQQRLAEDLGYRRYLINRGMKSKDAVGSSTLSYKREPLRVKLVASFHHCWEPRVSLLLVTWGGCSKMVHKLSSPSWLLCSALLSCPGSGIPQTWEITSPKPARQLKQPMGLLLLEERAEGM